MQADTAEKNISFYESLTQIVQYKGKSIRVWDRAIAQALRDADSIYMPDRKEPYYIYETIVLSSRKSLRLD